MEQNLKIFKARCSLHTKIIYEQRRTHKMLSSNGVIKNETHQQLQNWHSEECKLTPTDLDIGLLTSYQSAKFGNDKSSGFCFGMLTYTHTYKADKRPTPQGCGLGLDASVSRPSRGGNGHKPPGHKPPGHNHP